MTAKCRKYVHTYTPYPLTHAQRLWWYLINSRPEWAAHALDNAVYCYLLTYSLDGSVRDVAGDATEIRALWKESSIFWHGVHDTVTMRSVCVCGSWRALIEKATTRVVTMRAHALVTHWIVFICKTADHVCCLREIYEG